MIIKFLLITFEELEGVISYYLIECVMLVVTIDREGTRTEHWAGGHGD